MRRGPLQRCSAGGPRDSGSLCGGWTRGRGTRRRRITRGQRFHGVTDAERAARLQIYLLFPRSVTGQIQLNGVFARLDMKALHEAIEVVDDPGVVAVNEYLGLLRCDLQPDRRVRTVHTSEWREPSTRPPSVLGAQCGGEQQAAGDQRRCSRHQESCWSHAPSLRWHTRRHCATVMPMREGREKAGSYPRTLPCPNRRTISTKDTKTLATVAKRLGDVGGGY